MKRPPSFDNLAGLAVSASIALSAALFFVVTGAGRCLELGTIDWRTRFVSSESLGNSDIVSLTIGEASLGALEAVPDVGRWPWPRDVHAKMVDCLREAGARLVLYDVLFVEHDRARPAADEEFVNAVRRAGNVILAAQGQRQATAGGIVDRLVRVTGDPPADEYPRLLLPFPELADAAAALGAVNVAIDEDGVVRRGVLAIRSGGKSWASLPLTAAARLAGVDPRLERGTLVLGERKIPTDGKGRLLLRFRGRPPAFRQFSFVEVLRAYGEKLRGKPSSFDWEALRGRIVIVNATASGLFDQHSGPYGGEYTGGELTATVLDDLLGASALREMGTAISVAIAFAVALAAGIPVFFAGALPGFGAGVAVALAYAPLTVFAFSHAGIVMPLLSPVTAGLATVGLGAGWHWLTEGRRRRRQRAIFSRYVSDTVVTRLLDSPGTLDLGGTEAKVTVLFSDIRNFTTHSERLSPAALVVRLNEYFGAVTEAVFAEEGTIDKFIGDAVMAIFGAPLPQSDQAARAVRAGLGMLAALERLNETWRARGWEEWEIGVGIATGLAVVGNVGSIRRTEFTVIGDTVNLASRLEGQNKALRTKILVSEATAATLGGEFPLREHGEIHVKGKERPVKVFEVLS